MNKARRESENRVAFRTIDQKLDALLDMMRELKRSNDAILRVVTKIEEDGSFYDPQFCSAFTRLSQNQNTAWGTMINLLREIGARQTPIVLPEPVTVGYRDLNGKQQRTGPSTPEDSEQMNL